MTDRIQPRVFPLTRQSGRVALLLGVLDGHVGVQELQAAVALDVEPRPHRRPVMAWGRRFESITQAAAEAARRQPGVMTARSWQRWVKQQADADCWAGFYWCE